jgi:O-antigen chain-terminating methyltransferase
VAFKRVLRPLVHFPQKDLWERQRIFNLILLGHFQDLDQRFQDWRRHQERVDRDLEERIEELDRRTRHLENFLRQGLDEVLRHDDALFGRIDRKLDRYRREADELAGLLRSALAADGDGEAAAVRSSVEDASYLDFENRFRGGEHEIRQRVRSYLPRLREAAPVLDLGCGRGEALALLREEGVECRGLDSSAAMVRRCSQQGLQVEQGELPGALAGVAPGSLGGIVSFHVIEHLPPDAVDRLVRLAYTVLRPGGVLLLETPNPLSIGVTARSFWLDPTHVRPVHPEMLRASYESAGFTSIEQFDLRPYPEEERLPEIPLDGLDGQTRELADRLNRLRDDLDSLLFGYRDYALIGRRPPA